jgi:hypothetical protein
MSSDDERTFPSEAESSGLGEEEEVVVGCLPEAMRASLLLLHALKLSQHLDTSRIIIISNYLPACTKQTP